MGDNHTETAGSTPLFAVFFLSMYSLFLVPYTLRVFFKDKEKTWKKDMKSKGFDLKARVRRLTSWKLLLAWLLFFSLYWYIQRAMQGSKRFDPFEILGVESSANDQEIKRAYRKLSLKYHPDKNPDPAATEYFAEYISKAYKALTDDVSRENFKKYGHPDGPQALTVSVALPEIFFSKDKRAAPVILLSLLVMGILVPIAIGLMYLGRTNKYSGPHGLIPDTMAIFFHPPLGIKEAQGVGRIPETLVCAAEFIMMDTPNSQLSALEQLRNAVLRSYPDLKDKPQFWKRKVSVVKVHLLLLAHMAREHIPALLEKDLSFVLEKAPLMLQEMFKIATFPRIRPNYGWLIPAVACVETLQCLHRAVPVTTRKASLQSRTSEGTPWLLQLPGFNIDVVRNLIRQKVKSLSDLQALTATERGAALMNAGVSESGVVEAVESTLSFMPRVYASVSFVVEGPHGEEVSDLEAGDIVTCRVQLLVVRPRHLASDFDPATLTGKAPIAFTPNYPVQPVEEYWYFVLGNPSKNACMAHARRSLLESEVAGAKYATAWAAELGIQENILNIASQIKDPFESEYSEDLGQQVEFKFMAPEPGRHELMLYILPDSWLGCDRALSVKLKIGEPGSVDPEERFRNAAVLQRSEESELQMAGEGDNNEDDDAAYGDGDEEHGSYDSDEYGSEESEEEEGGEGG